MIPYSLERNLSVPFSISLMHISNGSEIDFQIYGSHSRIVCQPRRITDFISTLTMNWSLYWMVNSHSILKTDSFDITKGMPVC